MMITTPLLDAFVGLGKGRVGTSQPPSPSSLRRTSLTAVVLLTSTAHGLLQSFNLVSRIVITVGEIISGSNISPAPPEYFDSWW